MLQRERHEKRKEMTEAGYVIKFGQDCTGLFVGSLRAFSAKPVCKAIGQTHLITVMYVKLCT